MSDTADPNNAFLEIHAGAGGTESQDWAEMLLRCIFVGQKTKCKSFTSSRDTRRRGRIKSTTLKIEKNYAYGWLRREKWYTSFSKNFTFW